MAKPAHDELYLKIVSLSISPKGPFATIFTRPAEKPARRSSIQYPLSPARRRIKRGAQLPSAAGFSTGLVLLFPSSKQPARGVAKGRTTRENPETDLQGLIRVGLLAELKKLAGLPGRHLAPLSLTVCLKETYIQNMCVLLIFIIFQTLSSSSSLSLPPSH